MVAAGDLSSDLGLTILWRPDVDRTVIPDPGAAPEAVARWRPNLVIIDVAGLDETLLLVRRLRDDPKTRATAIAVLNRGLPAEAEDRLLASGVNAVLRLPVDPLFWDRRLEELLSVPARRAHRIPVRLQDWSRFVSDADEMQGAVVNIGARGVLLETNEPLELGTKLGLTLRLPAEEDDLHVVGQVVRLAGEDEGHWRSGVEFLVYRGDARERIAAFVDAEAAPDRPGPSVAFPLRADFRRRSRVGRGAAGQRAPQGPHPRFRPRLHHHRRPRRPHPRVQRRRAPRVRLHAGGALRARGDGQAGPSRGARGGPAPAP